MKRTLILIYLFIPYFVFCQSKHYVESYYSFGSIENIGRSIIFSSTNYQSTKSNIFGIRYGQNINNMLIFFLGLEYNSNNSLNSTITITDSLGQVLENFEIKTRNFRLPIGARVKLYKYIFTEASLIVSKNFSNNSRSSVQILNSRNKYGFGFSIHSGIQFKLMNSIVISAGPFVDIHKFATSSVFTTLEFLTYGLRTDFGIKL